MFSNSAPSLSDIAAVTDGNRNGGWSDGNGWWVLIILFALFGCDIPVANCCCDYDRITVVNTGTVPVIVSANPVLFVHRIA
jgi:hypothetical protein|nr:MAG TPA: Protein of unknown function (DUF1619) [Caudoviricetes sp.]